MHRLLRWLILPVLAILLFFPSASAQTRPAKGTHKDDAESAHGPPALQYGVAIIVTLAILTIVCYPSRKR